MWEVLPLKDETCGEVIKIDVGAEILVVAHLEYLALEMAVMVFLEIIFEGNLFQINESITNTESNRISFWFLFVFDGKCFMWNEEFVFFDAEGMIDG